MSLSNVKLIFIFSLKVQVLNPLCLLTFDGYCVINTYECFLALPFSLFVSYQIIDVDGVRSHFNFYLTMKYSPGTSLRVLQEGKGRGMSSASLMVSSLLFDQIVIVD